MNNFYRRPGFFGGLSLFPPVIKLLLISNIAIFVIFNLLLAGYSVGSMTFDAIILKYFALNPLDPVLTRDSMGQVIKLSFYPWQLVTYMFLHGGFWHLALNMFALWMFGMELENTWGQKRFLTYYMICGVGAGLCNLLIAPLFTTVGPTVGASGAIYGILVAFGYLFPNRVIYIYGLIPLKAKYLVILYMLIELFSVAGGSSSGIAHAAHLGGALIGMLVTISFYPEILSVNTLPVLLILVPTISFILLIIYKPEYLVINSFSKKQVRRTIDQEYNYRKKQQQADIDVILEKIHRKGMKSLTKQEKKALEDYSRMNK